MDVPTAIPCSSPSASGNILDPHRAVDGSKNTCAMSSQLGLQGGLSRCRVRSSRLQMNAVSRCNAYGGAPCLEGLGTEPTLRCSDEMATDVESIVDRGMCRKESAGAAEVVFLGDLFDDGAFGLETLVRVFEKIL